MSKTTFARIKRYNSENKSLCLITFFPKILFLLKEVFY